jgi:biotin-(acetyl-CoA carboxylase) ligase
MLTNEYSIEGGAEMLTNEYTIGDEVQFKTSENSYSNGVISGFKKDGSVYVDTGDGGARGIYLIETKQITTRL